MLWFWVLCDKHFSLTFFCVLRVGIALVKLRFTVCAMGFGCGAFCFGVPSCKFCKGVCFAGRSDRKGQSGRPPGSKAPQKQGTTGHPRPTPRRRAPTRYELPSLSYFISPPTAKPPNKKPSHGTIHFLNTTTFSRIVCSEVLLLTYYGGVRCVLLERKF